MSYCVNCGVELEGSLNACPLCKTPVINPNEIKKQASTPPFPKETGQVEVVKHKELSILLTIMVIATSGICILLNWLVFPAIKWSLLVAGVCLILWVVLIPFVIYSKLPVYVSVLLDGASIALYLYLITYLTPQNQWYYQVALPIVILTFVLIELIILLMRMIPVSILLTTLYLSIGTQLLCCGIETIVDLYLRDSVDLAWSMIVFTILFIINIGIITLLSRSKLRNAVRRRMHF